MSASRRMIIMTVFTLLGIVGGNTELPLIFCALVAGVAGAAYVPAGPKK